MGVRLGGSYNSQRLGGSHPPAARLAAGIRRLAATGRTVALLKGRRPSEFSPLADALAALREQHQFAVPSGPPKLDGAALIGRDAGAAPVDAPSSSRPAPFEVPSLGSPSAAAVQRRHLEALADSKNGAVPSQSQRRSRREEVTR